MILRLVLISICSLAASSITMISCSTPVSAPVSDTASPIIVLPAVFENINNAGIEISAEAISRPSIYRNLHKSDVTDNLSVELTADIDLPASPDLLNIYRIVRPLVNMEYAQNVAKQIGFNQPIEEFINNKVPYPQNQCFIIRSSDSSEECSLRVYSNGIIAIFFKEAAQIRNIPSDQECIRIARDWLISTKLYPDNVINVVTKPYIMLVRRGVDEYEYPVSTSVNFLMGIDGYELYGMGAYVSISNNGEICGAYINIPQLKKFSTANIRKSDMALDIFKCYLVEPSRFWANSPECLLSYIAPQMTIETASLKYFPMSNDEFVQPVYIFEGHGYTKMSEFVFDGKSYVKRPEPIAFDAYPFSARVYAALR